MTPLRALSTRWSEISALLDQALALPAAERASWLDGLPPGQAEMMNTLRELLAAHARVETGDFLGTLPKLAPSGGTAMAADEPASGDMVGPYRLISALGRGGMGAVWLAERADGQLRRPVALKLPRLAWGSALAERLARERDILATLSHPNIARLYDAGVDQFGRPYLAMEVVEGQSIDAYCAAHALPLRERLGLLLQVAAAVAHAHSQLVVHRDLKPGNILVTADAQVRLLDFGIAKLLEGDHTRETALTQLSGRALTLDYASPEQIRGAPLGTASDVYSLAVVAYELLAGARPYRVKRGSAAELEEAIASIDPPLASEVAVEPALKKQLRGDLDAILNKALKKDSCERYPTVEAFAQDVQRHLDHQPVLAQPDRFGYRAGKFVSRYRVQVAAAGVVALSLLLGAGLASWQARLAQQQATRAQAVKEFVLSFFEAADVELGASRGTTAVDLLKQARERLESSAITDAATRVELLTTIGSGLFGMGEAQLSAAVLEEATLLARQKLGEHHRATATATLAHGFALQAGEGCQAAASFFDSAAKFMRAAGDMKGLSGALRGIACSYSNQGDVDKAIDAVRESVRAAERQAPPVDKRTLLLAYIEAAAVIEGGIRAGSIEPARRALELAREIYGTRPAKLMLDAQSVHASALAGEGQIELALRDLHAVLGHQLQLLGADHQEVAFTRRQLGILYRRLGDPLAALPHLHEGLRIALVQSSGKPSFDVGYAHSFLGQSLANAHRFEEALDRWRLADQVFTALSGAEHEGARSSRSGAAYALTQLGRFDEADAIFAALLKAPPSSVLQEAAINGRLAELRGAQGRHDEALSLVRAADISFEHAPPAVRDRERALSLFDLAKALLAAERNAEALVPFLEARTLLRRTQPHGSPELADISLGIARAQLALGQAAQALAAADEATAFWGRYDRATRAHGIALLWKARSSAATKDLAGANAAARDAQALLAGTATSGDAVLIERTRSELAAHSQ